MSTPSIPSDFDLSIDPGTLGAGISAIGSANPATTRLDRSLRSGSFGAYIVFLIGSPLFTNGAAAFILQKVKKET